VVHHDVIRPFIELGLGEVLDMSDGPPVECLNRQRFKLVCEESRGCAQSLGEHLAWELGGKPPHRNGECPSEAAVRA
jgi:hypothetical protein